jgi:hypothetical protein
MRRLLTGYAVSYNLRHHRQGHLFQNRYKSIVCEEETYLLERVRYIHLNPLRAGLVDNLEHLAAYPWCGHAGVLGSAEHEWQDRAYLLARFGRSPKAAIGSYRQFVADGVPQGKRPDLVGGGLMRSQGKSWPDQLDPTAFDERVLGSGEFVERTMQQADKTVADLGDPRNRLLRGRKYLEEACEEAGIVRQELESGSRRGPVSVLRAKIVQELVGSYGWTLAETARRLGVSTSAVAKILTRASGDKSC